MCYLRTRDELLVFVRDADVMALLTLLRSERSRHAVKWSQVMHNGARHDVVRYLTLGVKKNGLCKKKEQSVITLGSVSWSLVAKVSWSRLENMLTSIDDDGKLCRVNHVFVDENVVVVDPITIEMLFSIVLGVDQASPWAAHVVGCLYACPTPRESAVVVMYRYDTCLRLWKRKACTQQLRVVVFQMAAVLSVLHAALEFRHNDLHDGNVLVQVKHNGSKWEAAPRLYYNIGGVRFEVPNYGFRAALCDFGLSVMTVNELHILRVELMRCSSVEKMTRLKSHCYEYLMTQPHMHESVDLQTLLRSMMEGLNGRRLKVVQDMYDVMVSKLRGVHTKMRLVDFMKTAFADWVVEKPTTGSVSMIDMNLDCIV